MFRLSEMSPRKGAHFFKYNMHINAYFLPKLCTIFKILQKIIKKEHFLLKFGIAYVRIKQ